MMQRRLRARNAWITAISSMRLLVVSGSPPCSDFSCGPWRNSTPQPPGPGLPLQAPSVQASTLGSAIDILVDSIGDRRDCTASHAPPAFLAPGGPRQAHAGHPLDGCDRVDGPARRPPAVARMLHEAPALQPGLGLAQGCIATKAAPVQFKGQELEPVLQACR